MARPENRTETQNFRSIDQVAERWQVSPKTVRRFVARKELVAHRIGGRIRVADADLIAFETRCRE